MRREWAIKKALKVWASFRGGLGDYGAQLAYAEHARAVRIVKRKIRSLTARIASDKRDGNEAGATLHVYALSILNSTLNEIQKGRA